MKNLNLLFNKMYYEGLTKLDTSLSEKERAKDPDYDLFSKGLQRFNQDICNTVFYHDTDFRKAMAEFAPHHLLMETMYPGMIIGAGNPHGTCLSANDINIGFSFDYVSGQVYIPGSTVKGALRSVFKNSPDAVAEVLQNVTTKTVNVRALEQEMFEGDDVYFDAVLYSGDKHGKFIGTDSITHHPDEPSPPIPLQLLKILPGVHFLFLFRFSDKSSVLTIEEKKLLVRYLLEIFGIGAKTNTGYGRLGYRTCITCRDCKKTYILSEFEQRNVETKGWKVVSCDACRKKNKN